MRRRILKFLKRDKGSALVFVAVSIFALAGMAVLGVDVARLLTAKAQLQNASDSGALGGAKLFLESDPNEAAVSARAREVTRMNEAFEKGGDELLEDHQIESVTVDMDEKRVTVVTRSVVSQYFTGVVGEQLFGAVRARSVAGAEEICSPTCLKPWSVPDRWDDQALIPGYPSWRNNERWNSEPFTDKDGDGYWNPGEPFTDGNNNGSYDAEYYDPLLTGYVASRDNGLQIDLHAGGPGDVFAPSQYFPVDLPNDPKGPSDQGASAYEWNIANCNAIPLGPGDWIETQTGRMTGPTQQGMRDLISQDPKAYWDESCGCVQGSDFAVSPRVGLIPLHDPRIPLAPGNQMLKISKVAAFFIESVGADASVVGRFMRVQAAGEFCGEDESMGGWVNRLALLE